MRFKTFSLIIALQTTLPIISATASIVENMSAHLTHTDEHRSVTENRAAETIQRFARVRMLQNRARKLMELKQRIEEQIDSVKTYDEMRALQDTVRSSNFEDRTAANQLVKKIFDEFRKNRLVPITRKLDAAIQKAPNMTIEEVRASLADVRGTDTLGYEGLVADKWDAIRALEKQLKHEFVRIYNEIWNQIDQVYTTEEYEAVFERLEKLKNEPDLPSEVRDHIQNHLVIRLENAKCDIDALNHVQTEAKITSDDSKLKTLIQYLDRQLRGAVRRKKATVLTEYIQRKRASLRHMEEEKYKHIERNTFNEEYSIPASSMYQL